MATYFLPCCGAKVYYEVNKPTFCVKCNKDIASAYVAPKPVSPTVIYVTKARDIEDDEPTVAPRQTRARTRQPTAQYYDENGNAEVIDNSGGNDEGDSYDPREVRRQARQLKASIQWKIEVNSAEEKSIKFSDHCCRGGE